MTHDVDPRLLRAFAALADELHFTRAAGRLFVAQQTLSRDVRRLEEQLGTVLFHRTTRQVEMTAEGERLLPYARRVLAAHNELAAASSAPERPLVVDVSVPVGTGQRVLDEARSLAPGVEFVARYHSGLCGAATAILDGEVDVSFGRVAGLPARLFAGLGHQLVRHERVAVLLPAEHPLAERSEIPVAELAGEVLYAGEGNPDTAEWTEYARALLAGPAAGARLIRPFPKIEGEAEFARLVRKRGWSVLASTVFASIPGMALRPLVDPVPLSPVSLVWRGGLRHPGLDALASAASSLAAAEDWLVRPPNSWLPGADARLYGERPERGGEPARGETPEERRGAGAEG